MTNEKQTNLSELAKRIRQHCIRMTGKANASHIGGALSAADLLAGVYGRALRYDPRVTRAQLCMPSLRNVGISRRSGWKRFIRMAPPLPVT